MLTFDHKPPVAPHNKVMEYNEMVADYNTEVADYNIVEKRKMKAGVEGGLFKEKKKMTEGEEMLDDHMKKKRAEFGEDMEEFFTFKEDVYKKKVDEFNLKVDEYNTEVDTYNDTMEDAYKKKMMHKKAKYH